MIETQMQLTERDLSKIRLVIASKLSKLTLAFRRIQMRGLCCPFSGPFLASSDARWLKTNPASSHSKIFSPGPCCLVWAAFITELLHAEYVGCRSEKDWICS